LGKVQNNTAFLGMIKRIVMMQLMPEKEAHFLDIFEDVKTDIRNREGCLDLEVLKSEDAGVISIWTISLWTSEDALNHYRSSALFQKTWAAVKPLFSSKVHAWTLTLIEKVP
jgi:quinol monooxygenase YgiN